MSGARESRLPLVLWSVATVVIMAAIVAGLISTGGPMHQRQKRMDERRVADLTRLQSEIGGYHQRHGRVPESLAALREAVPGEADFTRDPLNGEPYAYRRLNDDAFELCAVFATDARRDDDARRYYVPEADALSRHAAGRQCFQAKYRDSGGPLHGPRRFEWI